MTETPPEPDWTLPPDCSTTELLPEVEAAAAFCCAGCVPGMGADCPEWLCATWCFFSSRLSLYPLEQTAQTKGFSPVWMRTWVTYRSRRRKPLLQVSHL